VTVVTQARAGLTVSLNRAVAASRAPILARMDADDVALPDRFARQLAFLDAHPAVGLLGTACREVDAAGVPLRDVVPPLDDAAIRRCLMRANPFVHSSVMVRRAALAAAGGYDESLPVAQDYDLWFRMSRLTRMANLAEPLVLRRIRPGQVSVVRERERLRGELRIKARALARGGYGAWGAVHLVKPLVGLAMSDGMRRTLRRMRGGVP
jgi:glycosyltransferase involved in cell wall biosynthesis